MYEGMFLVDSALAAQDWQKILNEIQRILDRAQAEVISLKKWDERRLCYEINGKNRGTYILSYFNCDTDKVKGIERDVQLSELITRVLILRTDRMAKEDLERATPLEAAAAAEAEAAEKMAAKAAAAAEAASDAEAPAADAAEEQGPAEVDSEADAVADTAASTTPEDAETALAPEQTNDAADEKTS